MTIRITNKDLYTLEDMSSGENKEAFEAFSTSQPFRGDSRKRSNGGYELPGRPPFEGFVTKAFDVMPTILANCDQSQGNPRSTLALGCTNKLFSTVVNKCADLSFSSLFDRGMDSARVRLPSISCPSLSMLKNKEIFCSRDYNYSEDYLPLHRFGTRIYTIKSNDLTLYRSDISRLSNKEKFMLAGIEKFKDRFFYDSKIDSMLVDLVVKRKLPDINVLIACGFNREESEKIIDFIEDNPVPRFAEISGQVKVMKAQIFELIVTGNTLI